MSLPSWYRMWTALDARYMAEGCTQNPKKNGPTNGAVRCRGVARYLQLAGRYLARMVLPGPHTQSTPSDVALIVPVSTTVPAAIALSTADAVTVTVPTVALVWTYPTLATY